MFLKLNHYNLEVYKAAKAFRLECYKTFNKFPDSEKYNLIDQIRRASTSVVLNISEGCARKSETERKRFFEISRSSIVEIDTCYELGEESGYFKKEELEDLGIEITKTFILISGLLKK